MRKARHPFVMAGAAVIGATALAIAPVIATPADIKIVNPQVRPTASPFDAYRDAVEHVLANLEALLGAALAGPAPAGLNLEFALDSVYMYGDPAGRSGDAAGNSQRLRDSLDRNTGAPPAVFESVRTEISDALEAAIADLAAGRIDLAVGQLLDASAHLTVALLGPVVNGVGATVEAIQGIAAALDSGEPDRVRDAFVTAPALIAGRVLNGAGLSGPLSEVIHIGELLRAVAPPRSDTVTTVPLGAAPERVVTLDVNAGVSPPVVRERQLIDDPKNAQDAAEGTNEDVMAADGPAAGRPSNGHRPRPFGANSASQSGVGAGPTTVRDGIRDGIQGLRDGVRNVVKAVTGHGDGHGDSTTGSADESRSSVADP